MLHEKWKYVQDLQCGFKWIQHDSTFSNKAYVCVQCKPCVWYNCKLYGKDKQHSMKSITIRIYLHLVFAYSETSVYVMDTLRPVKFYIILLLHPLSEVRLY